MAFSMLPHWTGGSIFDIDPAALAGRGITLLLADLDNTLVPYGVPEPTEAVRAWNRALEEAGVTLFVLSNNRHPQRPERFAHALGRTPAQTAIVGDQIFTDILGGRNAGVLTLLVEPIRLAGNPGRYLRYAAEWPFRILGKRRSKPL